tara:strand:+ start:2496 stop:2840 length:345 start_codon:yes stop_codon:yes gene_type:complete
MIVTLNILWLLAAFGGILFCLLLYKYPHIFGFTLFLAFIIGTVILVFLNIHQERLLRAVKNDCINNHKYYLDRQCLTSEEAKQYYLDSPIASKLVYQMQQCLQTKEYVECRYGQ